MISVRDFNTWICGALLLALVLEAALGVPGNFYVMGLHVAFVAGLLVSRCVVRP